MSGVIRPETALELLAACEYAVKYFTVPVNALPKGMTLTRDELTDLCESAVTHARADLARTEPEQSEGLTRIRKMKFLPSGDVLETWEDPRP